MKDALGTEIEVGDLVLSAPTSGGHLKGGRIKSIGRYGTPSLVPEIGASKWTQKNDGTQRAIAVGLHVIVVKKHDGTVPEAYAAFLG